MMQPPEYNNGTGRVWQLLWPLYGLKQVGWAWNKELNQTFLKMDFMQLFSHQCIYIRHTDQDLLIMLVHIDDMTILGPDIDAITNMKAKLGKYFMIMDLGEAKQIVGLELDSDMEAGTLKSNRHNMSRRSWRSFEWQIHTLSAHHWTQMSNW